MIDEIFDRQYRLARNDINAALGGAFARFGGAIVNAFKVLNRIEYDAPWSASRRKLLSR